MTRRTFTALLRRPIPAAVRPGLEPVLLAVTTAALAAGGIARLAGAAPLSDLLWALGTVSAIVPAVVWVLAALRRGHAGWISSPCSPWAAPWPSTNTWPVP